MKVVIAGGSGSVGRRVADDFGRRGAEVVILTRSRRPDIGHRQVVWDGRTVGGWAAELEGSVVLNLAGELVDRRPTAANIELLRRSRVEPTRALVDAAAGLGGEPIGEPTNQARWPVAAQPHVSRARRATYPLESSTSPPVLWLQMSTAAIYGDAGEAEIDEDHAPADGPPQMAGVAKAWEQAMAGADAERVVVLRTSIVLDTGTPAFDRLTTLTRFGLGGRIGTGDQWTSWIHVDDFLRAVRFVADHPTLAGVVHLTAPNPIRNRDMMAALRSALHRPWSPPTPTPLVRLGARLLRTDPALALTGRRCLPRRLTEAGFEFDHPTFDAAIADLLGQPSV